MGHPIDRLVHQLDHRQGERSRLPAACLGSHHHVSAPENQGNRLVLHVSGDVPLHRLSRFDQLRHQHERFKGAHSDYDEKRKKQPTDAQQNTLVKRGNEEKICLFCTKDDEESRKISKTLLGRKVFINNLLARIGVLLVCAITSQPSTMASDLPLLASDHLLLDDGLGRGVGVLALNRSKLGRRPANLAWSYWS